MRSMLRAIVGVAVCVTPSAAFGAATEWQVAVLPKDRALVQSDFALAPTTPEPSANDLKDGEALFAMVYSSVDAATRVWLDGGGDAQGWGFFGKFQKKPGDTMLSFGAVLRVVASRHPQWQVGDMGVGASQIKSLLILDPEKAKLRKALGTIPPSHELSILGTTTGLTAHLAIDKLAPAGDAGVVYVSAAAGGVGLLAIQLFKLRGATKIIGSSGSDDKVRMLQSKYGIEAFNYKRQSVGEALAALAPDGVDIFFDNVGGATLDQALLQMRKFGTVITCGAVSEYSSDQTTAARNGAGSVRNMHAISDRSLNLRGFIIPDFAADFAAARAFLANQVLAGNLITEESIFSWDEFGAAHAALHAGGNIGKVLVAGPALPQSQAPPAVQYYGGTSQGGSQSVSNFIVSLGAQLGRDTSAIAHSLVNDHWIDDVNALATMPTAELISLGVPARLASLIKANAPMPTGHGSAGRMPPAGMMRGSPSTLSAAAPNYYASAAAQRAAEHSRAGMSWRQWAVDLGTRCGAGELVSVVLTGLGTGVLGILFPIILILGIARLASISGALRRLSSSIHWLCLQLIHYSGGVCMRGARLSGPYLLHGLGVACGTVATAAITMCVLGAKALNLVLDGFAAATASSAPATQAADVAGGTAPPNTSTDKALEPTAAEAVTPAKHPPKPAGADVAVTAPNGSAPAPNVALGVSMGEGDDASPSGALAADCVQEPQEEVSVAE